MTSSSPTACQSVLVVGTGLDRPGLVAGLTRVISEIGGNIEDASMTQLANTFAMLLLVSLPAKDSPDKALETLRLQSEPLAKALGITLDVRPVPLSPITDSAGVSLQKAALITVAGSDHMGITATVTQLLADCQVNITDLNAQRFAGQNGLVYMLLIEVCLPETVTLEALKALLAPLSEPLGVEIRVEAIDTVAL